MPTNSFYVRVVVHFSYFRVQFKDDASFATAHTSYAARDGRGTDSFFSVAGWSLNKDIFCAMRVKQILGMTRVI